MRRRLRRRRIQPAEMNITAFMNLMVILVPFLLITAVFTRLTILELNLPPSSTAAPDPKRELQLEVIVRADALEIGERSSGVLRRIEKSATGHDYAELSKTLRQIKERFPDKTKATILSEPNTSYDILVQVMDAVRLYQVAGNGVKQRYELFPEIAIGDAPGRANAAADETGAKPSKPIRTARGAR
ncbi:MAG TPA: biopolymer transporter ExbD [Burkholderiales bacterium]